MTITLEDANRAASAALVKANEISARISVTVCDPYGHIVAHQRMNGVIAEASHVSIGKAIAAAEGGRPSGDDLSDLPIPPRTGRVTGWGLPAVRRPGGLPIFRDGEVEGAIGVAGGPTDEQDEECAQAAITSLKSACRAID
jgi:uncharacterized protein GlcG (DUF336 family)